MNGIDLTTIHVPKYEMGCKCFEIIKELIENPAADKTQCILKGSLIQRGSCRGL